MSKELKEHLRKLGSKGGKVTAKKYGSGYYSELALRSAEAKRRKKLNNT